MRDKISKTRQTVAAAEYEQRLDRAGQGWGVWGGLRDLRRGGEGGPGTALGRPPPEPCPPRCISTTVLCVPDSV